MISGIGHGTTFTWASPRRTIIMKRIRQNRPKEGIFLKNCVIYHRCVQYKQHLSYMYILKWSL